MTQAHRIAKHLTRLINREIKFEEIEKEDLEKLKGIIAEELNQIALLIQNQAGYFGKPNFQTLMGNVPASINSLIKDLSETAEYLYNCKAIELRTASGELHKIVSALHKFRNALLGAIGKSPAFQSSQEALEFFSQNVAAPFRTKFLPHINLEEREDVYNLNWQLSRGHA